MNAHQCSIDIFELYSDDIAVQLNASKERLLEEYQKKYELEEMPITRFTRPQATATSTVHHHAQPAPIETFGEQPGDFSTKETPHLHQRTTMQWPLPQDLQQESYLPNQTPL